MWLMTSGFPALCSCMDETFIAEPWHALQSIPARWPLHFQLQAMSSYLACAALGSELLPPWTFHKGLTGGQPDTTLQSALRIPICVRI